LLWCSDLYSGQGTLSGGDYRDDFWSEIHHTLQYRHGRPQLSDQSSGYRSPAEDSVVFLLMCGGEEFLDFLEDIFRVEGFWRHQHRAPELVAQLNDLLRVDGLPYSVTDLVTEPVMVSAFGDHEMESTRVREYPRLIPRDSEPIQQEVIEPVLALLSRSEFAAADAEYLAALDDLRKGDYEDCLTKCCSAFESAMKIICELKRWPYRQTDTASTLIKTILGQTSLDSYFETTLQIVATLRNRLGSSHGAGVESRQVPRHLASYAVQLTGASILLLAREAEL